MYVLGTAGHVDHGKSTLVFALTGIDPDRLPEEKERHMTIDLGFAWLKLPSGREVSIVDVPGHEKFIKNMLAGVGGIDIALLIIAANEGVMPQTLEHLTILDLLNLRQGIIVLTKNDLVDREIQELAVLEATEALKNTSLEGAPMVVTSAVTGEGLVELVSTIDRMLDSIPQRRDIGKPRLFIDRIFSMKGFGTVVTGTLIDGRLSVGQQVEILPTGQRVNIRGLQTHNKEINQALPGSRVAVNLTSITTEELKRGFLVTEPGWIKPTRMVDVKISIVTNLDSPVLHNTPVTFFSGSCEATGKLRLLDRELLKPGEVSWSQVRLEQPVAVAQRDLFILRSLGKTIAGGEVVDPYAKRHPRLSPVVIKGLEARGTSSIEESLLATLKTMEPSEAGAIARLSNLSAIETRNLLECLISKKRVIKINSNPERPLFFSLDGWKTLTDSAENLVREYHRKYPLRKGMPKDELKNRLRTSPQYFDSVLQALIDSKILVKEGFLLRLPSHNNAFSKKQKDEANSFLRLLSVNPYRPSRDSVLDPEVMSVLIEDRRVVKVAELTFLASAYKEMVDFVLRHLKSNRSITVAQLRDRFKSNRRCAQVILEDLDSKKITRRSGNEHVAYST